jgi:hypothetical protein
MKVSVLDFDKDTNTAHLATEYGQINGIWKSSPHPKIGDQYNIELEFDLLNIKIADTYYSLIYNTEKNSIIFNGLLQIQDSGYYLKFGKNILILDDLTNHKFQDGDSVSIECSNIEFYDTNI